MKFLNLLATIVARKKNTIEQVELSAWREQVQSLSPRAARLPASGTQDMERSIQEDFPRLAAMKARAELQNRTAMQVNAVVQGNEDTKLSNDLREIR